MLSIKENITNEIIIDKSRFITEMIKINDENEIKEHILKIKQKYRGATHYCYAYICNNVKRFNDDGEPNGTAGVPILNVLENNNLNYILCIVIRYFGGIKLGSGGLVRAYSNSVIEALKKGIIVELIKGKLIEITFNYDNIKNIDYILKDIPIISKSFNNNIIYQIEVSNENINIINELNNYIINTKVLKEILIEK